MEDKIYTINNLDDIPGVAKQFLDDHSTAKLFAFQAPMGSGKTTFIVALLKAIGIAHPEGSPTYSIVNTYDSPLFHRIYHMDLYRLKSIDEVYDSGIEEHIYSGARCFIEWPEILIGMLPEQCIWVYIRKNEDNSRTITVKYDN
jgi:tRNA threonylcarbamoyladenosine biosynthesis protein TsaE